jgi:putative hydrolase of the HAD superfamily
LKNFFEVPEKTILTLVYDILGLNFSISIEEIEKIIWNNDAVKVPVQHAKELLDALNGMEIQTAVLSNLDFSGDLLRQTLSEVFPNHQFKFVIASSDYGVRKPNRYIFEAAISQSGFSPSEIWYVGDKIKVDVVGSRAAGMVPVLYKFARNSYADIPNDITVIDDMLDLLNYL